MESSVAVKMTFTSAPMLGNKVVRYRVGLDGGSASRPCGQDALRPWERGGMAWPGQSQLPHEMRGRHFDATVKYKRLQVFR